MSGPTAAGTFATASTAIGVGSQVSDVCVINTGRTSMRLTITGADASNRVRTQKRTSPGGDFVDQTTFSALCDEEDLHGASLRDFRRAVSGGISSKEVGGRAFDGG